MTNPFTRPVVLDLPGTEAVTVRREVPWGAPADTAGSDDRVLDVYRPPARGASDATRPLPAVVLVTGYPDPGFQALVGQRLKDTAPYVSWARAIAASGLAAVTYTNREPVADAAALLRHLAAHASDLGLDPARVGLWACSGNVPTALALLVGPRPVRLRCAAFCYGYLLDLAGATEVADAAARFRFAHPAVDPAALRADIPILLARAGRDEMPGLNASLDRFRTHAASTGLDVRVVEHPAGPHAFDVMDDSDASRAVIRGVLDFLRGV